jgi:hypothetical protein
MSAGAFCPICRRLLSPSQWNLSEYAACPNCRASTRTLVFPAINRSAFSNPPVPRNEAEASCFFHPAARADHLCDSCGRFLCSLCTVSFGVQKLCPDCIFRKRKQSSDPLLRDQAILFDNWALLLLTLPVLCLLYIYLGLVFSAVAFALVIIGWKRQRTLTPRSRYRFTLAALLALVEGGAWIALFWLLISFLQTHASDFRP